MAKCGSCGGEAGRNKPLCDPCTDHFWLGQPVKYRPWSWTRKYIIRRDGAKCRMCNRARQNYNPNCLLLRKLRGELGRELTNEEISLVLGIRPSELYLTLTVHHIVERAEGGTDILENLMTLCRECHDKVHGQTPKHKKRRKKKRD